MTTYSGKPKSSESGIRQYKRYPAYKDSGVEWLSEIPAHWAAKRLRFVVETSISKQEVRDFDPETEVSFVPMEAVQEYGGIDLDSTKALSEVAEGYTYFRNGDVIVAKITPCFENGKGAMATGLRNDVGFGTTELHVLRTSSHVDPRFLLYLTFSDHFRRIGTSSMYGAGGQKRISDDFIRDFSHPVPSLPEQRVIAAFLDRETASVDALVAKKERLIELLQEKRTALINLAVTRGLDPNVPMKDSGVEWLGKIPAHWDVKRLKYLTTVNDEALPETTDPGTEIAYVDIGNVDSIQGITDVEVMVFEDAPSRARRVVRQGDVIVSTVRTYLRAIAQIETTDANLIVSTGFAVLRPHKMDYGYVAYAATAPYFVETVVAHSVGVSYPAINASELACLDIVFPPIDEQCAIAAFLDRETAQIEALVDRVSEAIDRLKELRQALISAAVTGKIDVRQEAA